MRTRRLLLTPLLALVLAGPAAAQPSARALLEAWTASWQRAWDGSSEVVLSERAEQTVDGPRRDVRIETEGTLSLAPGARPERTVTRARVNGRPADAERGPRSRERLRRAFGPPGREVLAPPRLPIVWVPRASPRRVVRDTYAGRPAWRVDLDVERFDRAAIWFTRSERSPQLLGSRAEGTRPRGGQIVREVRYARTAGLDLPAQSETTFEGRQRRRLRDYVVTLRAVGTYTVREVR